ncbi:hypothetical protein ECANGB1_2733 [Enterospora canceri]|uniref:Uncharacterized protein n=1 Tax=Enterospora canceri TaxID=1081671 RepID=A0A1Y1S4G6_9MICR|nr:hypothetical protein ECANGB1_2733 [Enterospora canceri]
MPEITMLLDFVLYWRIIFLYFSSNSSGLVDDTSFVPAWMIKRVLSSASLVTSPLTSVMSSSLAPGIQ